MNQTNGKISDLDELNQSILSRCKELTGWFLINLYLNEEYDIFLILIDFYYLIYL